jgi:polysaccharide export outer membrane protein
MEVKKLFTVCSNYLLIIGIAMFFFSSCIPNRKIAYLQYGDELKQVRKIPLDSMVRVYKTGAYQYKLQSNDLVDIKIATTTPDEYNPFSLADRYISMGGISSNQLQSMGYRIDPEGFLNLPIIGRLKVSGMTVWELEDTITRLASADLEAPVTKINLINFRFSVMGEVNGEGTLQTSENTLSLLQAMSMAGGISEYGDLSRVKVVRKINEESYVFYVNLLDESFLSSNFYYVQPNDVILVAPMKNRSLVKNVPQTLGFVASTLSLIVTVITLVAVTRVGN